MVVDQHSLALGFVLSAAWLEEDAEGPGSISSAPVAGGLNRSGFMVEVGAPLAPITIDDDLKRKVDLDPAHLFARVRGAASLH